MSEPVSRFVTWEKGSKSVRKALILACSLILLSGCSTLGIGASSADVTANQSSVDTLLADNVQLQAEIARLKSDNARLSREVSELERVKTAALAKKPSPVKEPEEPVIDDGGIELTEVPLTPSSTIASEPKETVVAAANADATLPDAPVPVDDAPRLVQPTFTSSEQTVFENEAEGQPVQVANGLWGVHLASYRKPGEAKIGWRKLQREHPDELGLLEPRIERVSVKDKGEFLRLIGGGFSAEDKARALCTRLKGKGMFCNIANFGGERLSFADAG